MCMCSTVQYVNECLDWKSAVILTFHRTDWESGIPGMYHNQMQSECFHNLNILLLALCQWQRCQGIPAWSGKILHYELQAVLVVNQYCRCPAYLTLEGLDFSVEE